MEATPEMALAVETGGDVAQAVQAAHTSGFELDETVELSGLSMRRVLEVLGRPGD